MSERGELKKQIQRMIWTHGYPSKSLVENMLDEARKDFHKYFCGCCERVLGSCSVCPIEKWFGSE